MAVFLGGLGTQGRRAVAWLGLLVCAVSGAGRELTRLDWTVAEALPEGFAPGGRSAVVTVFARGGRALGVRVAPPVGSPTYAPWEAAVEASALRRDGSAWRGTVTVRLRPAAGESRRAVFDLRVPDDPAAPGAAVTVAWDGAPPAPRAVEAHRTVAPVPDPADAVIALRLAGAAEGRDLHALLVLERGRVARGFAFAPAFNHTWHDLDGAALAVRDGRLAGTLRWTLQPDPWVLEDRQPRPGERTLDLDLRPGFSAQRGDAPAEALVLAADDWSGPIELELKFEDGLIGGEAWQNRAFARLRLDGERAEPLRLFNNKAHAGWSGTLDAARIRVEAGAVEGELMATVAAATVQPGVYRIRFRGTAAGGWLAGDFTTELAGDGVKQGRWAGWRRAPEPAR